MHPGTHCAGHPETARPGPAPESSPCHAVKQNQIPKNLFVYSVVDLRKIVSSKICLLTTNR